MIPIRTRYDFDFSSPPAQEAIRIIDRLREAGFTAYLAGGSVRDALLGKSPKDYDVATDATPDAIRGVFGKKRTLAFGASFGVVGVLPDRRDSVTQPPRADKVEPTEVATFRSDGVYLDGRRPDSVHFGSAEADALRRDFTINGLFFDPVNSEIIDYVCGREDLQRSLLRTIGDARQRFAEDKLRMLRAVRFATTIGFQIAPETANAIAEKASEIEVVSGERIGVEMRRCMASEHVLSGLDYLTDLQLMRYVLPELAQMDHAVIHQLFLHRRQREFPSALALLLLASPSANADLRAITERWKLSNEEVRIVTAALRGAPKLAIAHQVAWSKIQPILIDRDVRYVLDVACDLAVAEGLGDEGLQRVKAALELPSDVLDPPPLLNGSDLARLKIPAGPVYAKILNRLRQRQLDGELSTREQAIDEVRTTKW
ncbi:CCA tRNA nucleotidyltransferase [Novipirellula maiorica]|uniref:CCA tRNA nucleotidyltransferase n=1 Tax=Novipirellula maiorica TaxID=1265734 RepID=UPI00034D2A16|nr:CCA tRNA nucleotidyltransferase [Rhodopirellula maiorica]